MSARDYALFLVDSAALPEFKPRLLRRRVTAPDDPRDLALAEQIYVGVVKNLLLLHALTEHHSNRRIKDIDPVVRKILAVALYQLRFLRVPAHSAVDEAVEQAKRFGRSKAAGFVNAVLRNATRIADPELPLHIQLSHPPELLERLTAVFGQEQAIAQCRKHNTPPPMVVRLCRGAAANQLQVSGVTISEHEAPGMLVVQGARQATFAEWARRGLAQVQDPTSAEVTSYLELAPGQTVLDRCCGVGTKTMQMWEQIQPGGRVFAIDPNRGRCDALRRLLAERNIGDVGVIEAAWMKDAAHAAPGSFDGILVDAPCSNSGVLIRRPEARYFQTDQAMKLVVAAQSEILAETACFVMVGGLLVYSTCSIWPEENERIVERFVRSARNFELLESSTTYPSVDPDVTKHHDGGFVANFRRVR